MPGLKVKPRELSVRRQFKSKRAKNDPTGTLKRIKRVEKEIIAKLRHTTQKIKENVVLHHRSLEIRKSTPINVDPETINKTVERIIEADLVNPAFDIVEVEVPAAYRAGNTFGSIALGGTPEFRQDEAKKITVLVQASKSLFKGLGDDYGKKIKDIISRGILLEKSYLEIYKEIGDSVGVSEARAKAIVRTEVMKSVNTGVKERYKTAGVEKVEWLTVMDFKDDNNPCEECEELDGKTFPIGETPEIPVHPNCRCTLIPVIEMPEGDWYDDEEEQQDTDLDTHIDDFNSRFKDSDIEHGRVFDSSGKLVEEVTGNKNSVNYNTDRKNMHSIHNHPNGCPALSPEDIASAIYEDMASQTASNGSESWTLSRPDSGWKISGFEYDTKIDLISQIKTEFSDIIKNSPEREKYKSRVLSGDISVKEANLEFTKHVSRTFLENHKLTILERK